MKKFSISLFLIITMGLVLSYWMINSYVIDSAVELEQQVLKSEVQVMADYIEILLSEKSMLVRQMANYESIVTFMSTLESREKIKRHPGYSEVLKTLQNIQNSDKCDVDLVFFVSESGNAIIKHNEEGVPSDWSLRKRQWYIDTVAKGDTFITNPYPDALTGKMVISMAYPIIRDKKVLGATGIDVTISTIAKIIENHKIGEKGYLILVDRNGIILSHPRKELILQQLSVLPEFKDKNIVGRQVGVDEYFADGEQRIGAFASVPLSGWSLLAVQPKADVMKKITNIQKVILGVFLAIFFLLVVVAFIVLKTLKNLRQTQERMVTSEKMASLGKLVAGVAHEINTPLGVALTASSFLKDISEQLVSQFENEGIRKSDLLQYIRECQESTGIVLLNIMNVSHLVKSFKQVAADQSSDVRRFFNVREYLGEIILTLHPVLKKTKHSIAVKCDENMKIYSIPGVFSQIITNFIMNSLIHAYNPEDAGQITIEMKKSADKYILIYEDDGNGMDETTIGKVFEPFFTTNIGGGGTGLGLYLVYNLVTLQLMGTIRCTSELGKGTKFMIEIPQL